ncbi:MAG: hypothetical protein WAK60_12215 [Sedimentisphaerales bacterium]
MRKPKIVNVSILSLVLLLLSFSDSYSGEISQSEKKVSISGTIDTFKNSQGEIVGVIIVDDGGKEILVSKEDANKLMPMVQKKTVIKGYLKTGMMAVPVKLDDKGNKVQVKYSELYKLSPNQIVELGLGEVQIISRVEVVDEKDKYKIVTLITGILFFTLLIFLVVLFVRKFLSAKIKIGKVS